MPENLPWIDAIKKVLTEANDAMHYGDIAEQIIKRELRTEVGATPKATVSSNITTSINALAEKSPFRRVGKGLYVLSSQIEPVKTKAAQNEVANTRLFAVSRG
jgi:hypothetical protein